jgi:integrase
MSTIRFSLRWDKVPKGKIAPAPIELVYQIKGQRKYYNTGFKCFRACWDVDNQKAIYLDKKTAKRVLPSVSYDLVPTEKETAELNISLSDIDSKIKNFEKRFELNEVVYSAQMVIDMLKAGKVGITKVDLSSKILFNFIDQYIETHKTTREPGSLSVYRALKMHLEAYQKEMKKNITFDSINYGFFQSFQNFLIEKRNLKNATVAKQLSTIKTFLNYAKQQGIEVSDRYKNFKIKKESLEVIALTNEEFELLYNYDLSDNKKLAHVRDVFCFACVTGLRYSDLAQLKREHIKEDEIKLTVKKTKEPLTIPLTPYSKAILKKYEGMYKPLPVISNQKMNQYLKGWDKKDQAGSIVKHHKGLCELAGINEQIEIVRFKGAERISVTHPKYELIGVHTGRKTFATLSLEKGMSAEEVMTVTGHKDYKSFKRYVKVTEQRKKVVMLKAWGDVPGDTKLKAV